MTATEVKVDITIGELIVLPLRERPVLKGYEEYEDLPEEATILVYSLEEILTEKLVALTDRARNEPRDLYDFWYLTELESMDLSALIPEITAKLAFRGRGLEGMGEEFGKKKRAWKNYGGCGCQTRWLSCLISRKYIAQRSVPFDMPA